MSFEFEYITLLTKQDVTSNSVFVLDKCHVELWDAELEVQNSYYSNNTDAEHGKTYQVESFGNAKANSGIKSVRIKGKNCVVELESEIGGLICTVRHGDYKIADFTKAGCLENKITQYTVLGIIIYMKHKYL